MVKEIQYTSIKEILSNIMLHPMLKDVTLEQAVIYTLRFMGLHGLPHMYQDKIGYVDIEDFRGLLPCDLVSINQVKDCASGICLRSMTDSFPRGMMAEEDRRPFNRIHSDLHNNVREEREMKHLYIPPRKRHFEELAFKTQGRVIYTSFREGRIMLSYKSIPVDEDGFPLLIDNEVFKSALEWYIKQEVFTYKFDQGKISAQVLQNTQQQYAFKAGQLQAEFLIPSQSEMQSLTNYYNSLIPRVSEFYRGFKHLGDREILRRH